MANRVLVPGFETTGAWSYTQQSERTDAFGAHDGSFAGRVWETISGPPPPVRMEGILEQTGLAVTPGDSYRITFWTMHGPSESELSVDVNRGGGPNYETLDIITHADLPEDHDWTYIYIGAFVAAGPSASIRFRVNNGALAVNYWLLDTVSVDDVAIRLSERAVDAMVATLQTRLAAELAAIETERGDSVTLAVPPAANYYKRPKGEIAGDTVHIEVFESEFKFTDPYLDAQNRRAVADVPLVVRLTCFNRDNASAETMMKRMRRYGAALKIVLVTNPFLQNNDSSILTATMEDYVPQASSHPEDPSVVERIVVTARMTVTQEEAA